MGGPAPAKAQSVPKGFAVLSAAGIAVKVLSLIYVPFLLYLIGDEGNGIYAAAFQVYVLLYAVTNSGVPTALSKLVSELTAKGEAYAANQALRLTRTVLIAIGLALCGLLAIFHSSVAELINYPKAGLSILMMAPAFVFCAVSSSYRGFFQGRGYMTPTAVSQVMEQVCNIAFSLLFASILLPMGLEAACAGATVGTSIGAVVAAAFLIRSYRSNRHVYESVPHGMGGDAGTGPRTAWGAGALLRRIGSYSVPIVLTIGLQYAGNLIDVAVTKSRLMSGGFIEAEASQLYSHLYKYQQLLNAPIAISAALAATILPAVAAAIASGDREALNGRVGFAYKLCFSVTIPCMVGFTVLSGPIYGLLKYGDGSDLLMYGSACLVLLATVQIQTSILQGLGRLYAVNRNLMLGIAAKIALNYLLVPIPGLNIKGAIIGSVFSYLIPIALNAATLKGHSRRNPGMAVDRGARAHLWKPLASSAYMGFIVFISHRLACLALSFVPSPYAVEAIASVAAVAAGVASYLYFLRSFKGIDAEMLDMLPRRMASKLARLIEK